MPPVPRLPTETAEQYAQRLLNENGATDSAAIRPAQVYTPVEGGGYDFFGGNGPQALVAQPGGTAAGEEEFGIVPPPKTASEDDEYSVAQIFDLMSIGKFTPEEAQAELVRKGYDAQEAENLMALANKGAAANPELSLGMMFDAVATGTKDQAWLNERLVASGYSQEDANILLGTFNKEQATKAEELRYRDEQRADAAADEARSEKRYLEAEKRRIANEAEADRRYAESEKRRLENEREQKIAQANSGAMRAVGDAPRQVNAQVAGGQQAKAKEVLNDFRSNFVNNLRTQGAGLSTPQKQWALDNMDMFLPQFLGRTEGAAFTLGAAEIASAYEGTRNTQRSSKSGAGLIQTRSL
jgi:hypothetical protein